MYHFFHFLVFLCIVWICTLFFPFQWDLMFFESWCMSSPLYLSSTTSLPSDPNIWLRWRGVEWRRVGRETWVFGEPEELKWRPEPRVSCGLTSWVWACPFGFSFLTMEGIGRQPRILNQGLSWWSVFVRGGKWGSRLKVRRSVRANNNLCENCQRSVRMMTVTTMEGDDGIGSY